MSFRSKVAQWSAVATGVALTASLVACETPSANSPAPAPQANAPATNGNGGGAGGQSVTLSGAGASFPAPLYQRWFSEYNRENPTTQISYQSVGSGAGVQQFLAGTIDFGASDAPLTQEERQQFQSQFNGEPIQVPLTGGAVVLAYNLGGNVQNLRLSREAYCGIAEGRITNWNDPAIAAENSGVNLPDLPITFVHRSDGSGTTFIFTNHLEAACPNWAAGAAKSVEWPVGVGGKGNEGITAQVQQTQGAIGYVEYAYARENGLNSATLENQAGEYVAPDATTAAAALEGQQIPADFALEVPDPTAREAYPIVGLTWLLLYNNYQDPAKATALRNFIDWALTQGDQYATELGYIPVSNEVAQRVQTAVSQNLAAR